jgi:hypothetical protein
VAASAKFRFRHRAVRTTAAARQQTGWQNAWLHGSRVAKCEMTPRLFSWPDMPTSTAGRREQGSRMQGGGGETNGVSSQVEGGAGGNRLRGCGSNVLPGAQLQACHAA